MVPGTSPDGGRHSGFPGAVYFGAAAALVSLAGLLGIFWGITVLASIYPGYRSIAFSAALFWIVLGILIAIQGVRPFRGPVRSGAAVLCAGIAVLEIPEVLLGINGGHFIAESVMVRAGDAVLMHPTIPISPAASVLLALSAIGLILVIYARDMKEKKAIAGTIAGLTGLCVTLAALTFVLGYVYGIPFLEGTGILPIALTSALSAACAGLGLVALAGKDALPLAWLSGESFRARLFRTFLPLTVAIVVFQNILQTVLAACFGIRDALLLACVLLVFCLVTGTIIAGTARRLGNDLDRAQQSLVQSNTELNAAYNQISASNEELRQQYDELAAQDEKLKISESRNRELADLLDRSSQPFAVGYPDGRLAMYNQAFCRLTGYTSEELEKIDWSAVLTPPEWRENEARELETLARTGEPVRYEKEYLRKDAVRVPVELFVHSVRDGEGRPVKYYSFITDISERKRAGLLLEKSEEKFRLLAEFAYDWEYWISPEGRFVYVSPSCERITGYTADEFMNDPGIFSKIVHEDDRDRIGTHLTTITEAPAHHAEEFRIRRKDGGVCWIGHTCHAIYDAGGRWIGRRASNRDITKRHEAEEEIRKREEDLHAAYEELTASDEELRENYEELARGQVALRESGERFRALFDHMIEGLALHELVYDALGNPAEYRILAVNEGFEKQIGISRSAVLGKLSCEAYGVEAPPFLDRYAKVALTGEAEQFETYFEPLKKYFHISAYSPKKGHFATVFEDITVRRNEERALRLADRKLQLMNIVAWHDIQNKVTSLRGYIELSRDLVADETAKKMLRSEDEILKVIHQQLGYTREYQEIGTKPSEWVDIHAMLSLVIALKGSRSVTVTTNVDGLVIFTDPILEKVFSHLIENTLVHAPAATEIRIWYRETADSLVLVYEDNGPGIAEENKQDLFVRTFATTRFGLFFIHDILELSGIGFAETGEPGKGVRFEMTVPRGMYRITPRPGPGA
ncbi:PAS domain S-box protein [Methanoregula sp. UBA64]|jgi:PAS domain S-box-containing protein|uniref:PAS domain S-box protein n=1 Tax=Methanoregula sp. UBA64 TaxID=1915554 RepID=UPI0025DCACD6|nr:PAS domain S-box protein [Methanoregula sp. UBA64]